MEHILDRLAALIARRQAERPAGSYVVQLLDHGPAAPAEKVLEEAEELVRAAVDGLGHAAVAHEAADLLFHALVLIAAAGVPIGSVWAQLEARCGTSGLAEKAARPPEGAREG